jgi:hypothetical protein
MKSGMEFSTHGIISALKTFQILEHFRFQKLGVGCSTYISNVGKVYKLP